jgi:hypothetical protein
MGRREFTISRQRALRLISLTPMCSKCRYVGAFPPQKIFSCWMQVLYPQPDDCRHSDALVLSTTPKNLYCRVAHVYNWHQRLKIVSIRALQEQRQLVRDCTMLDWSFGVNDTVAGHILHTGKFPRTPTMHELLIVRLKTASSANIPIWRSVSIWLQSLQSWVQL